MGSKLINFSLITTVIINIIIFIFILIIIQSLYDEIFKNKFIYDVLKNDIPSIDIYFIVIIMLLLGHELVDFLIYYKLLFLFNIIVNSLFLSIILKKKYNKLIYFVYIINNILFMILIYYISNLGKVTPINILIDYKTFIRDNLFLHIIFFLEVILPIIHLKIYKSILKN